MSEIIARLVFDVRDDFDYRDDVDRIVEICRLRGYEISPSDARAAWEDYSDMMAAGWMCLGPADHVFASVENRCRAIPFEATP